MYPPHNKLWKCQRTFSQTLFTVSFFKGVSPNYRVFQKSCPTFLFVHSSANSDRKKNENGLIRKTKNKITKICLFGFDNRRIVSMS